MTSSDAQQQRNDSRSCNEDVLLDIGFSRVGGSSLYKNGTGAFILSPGISKGRHEKYWFDIRDANLQKMSKSTKSWVLLRIVPGWFAFFAMESIRKYMNKETQDVRMNSGLVYGFYCELDERNRLIEITAKNDMAAAFSLTLLDRTDAKKTLSAAMEI
jgi:hypothetical protein